jgi:diguanylate cyclase
MLERSRKAETDLRAATQKIKRLQSDLTEARTSSLVDELSKLPNRRAAKQLLERLEEDRIPSAIAIVDIDHFKRVNDTFGHPVGDRVIAHVGRILTETMAPDMVARWGGEEYLVIAQEGSSETLAERLDRARMEVASRKLKVRETDAQLGDITFSAGVATSSENSTDAMEKADALLYEAKQSGRNRICSSSKFKAA